MRRDQQSCNFSSKAHSHICTTHGSKAERFSNLLLTHSTHTLCANSPSNPPVFSPPCIGTAAASLKPHAVTWLL